jgi:hypothetical protein
VLEGTPTSSLSASGTWQMPKAAAERIAAEQAAQAAAGDGSGETTPSGH